MNNQNKMVMIRIPSVDSIDLVAAVVNNQIEFRGFPKDFKIRRIDYEETSAFYYFIATSESFPLVERCEDIPLIHLEAFKDNDKGVSHTVINFSFNNRVI